MHSFSFPARALTAAALLCFAGAAAAHVTLEYQVAHAGASYKASFRVGHGCGASPTRQVSVDIPAGVRAVHPMPKPGWKLDVERAAEVVRITWSARTPEDMLASSHYDEFVLVGRMPQQAGTLYWPVRQLCEQGRNDWVEVPQPGQPLSDLKSPAAALQVMPAAGAAAGHAH